MRLCPNATQAANVIAKTINDANTVINSAMAPSDPSGQDYKVASQAQKIKIKAQSPYLQRRVL